MDIFKLVWLSRSSFILRLYLVPYESSAVVFSEAEMLFKILFIIDKTEIIIKKENINPLFVPLR